MATTTTRADSSNSSSSINKNGSSRSSSSSTSSARKAGSSSKESGTRSTHGHDSDDDDDDVNVIDGESLIKLSEVQPLTKMHGEDSNEKLLPDDEDAGHRMEVFETEYIEPTMTSSFEDWLYPPGLPRSCQLLRRENIAIPACYLLV